MRLSEQGLRSSQARIEWMLDGWLHTIEPEGKLFRWRSEYVAGGSDERPGRFDLGLVPGGVLAAVFAMQEQIARNHCSRCGSEMAVCYRCVGEMDAETGQRASEGRDGLAGRLARALEWFRGHVSRSDADSRLGLSWLAHDAEARVAETDVALAEARAAGLLDGPAGQSTCACGAPGPGNAAACHRGHYGRHYGIAVTYAIGGRGARYVAECQCSCHRRTADEPNAAAGDRPGTPEHEAASLRDAMEGETVMRWTAMDAACACRGVRLALEPTPDCCPAWPRILHAFAWMRIEGDEDSELRLMPSVRSADGTSYRINYCPSCGTECRDAIVEQRRIDEARP